MPTDMVMIECACGNRKSVKRREVDRFPSSKVMCNGYVSNRPEIPTIHGICQLAVSVVDIIKAMDKGSSEIIVDIPELVQPSLGLEHVTR